MTSAVPTIHSMCLHESKCCDWPWSADIVCNDLGLSNDWLISDLFTARGIDSTVLLWTAKYARSCCC